MNNRKAKIVRLATLQGEEMHKFRTGPELYAYCNTCVHAEYTPITNVLGCTNGDEPEVLSYSNRLAAGQTSEAAEKCPGFIDRVSGAEGTVSPNSVLASKDPLEVSCPRCMAPAGKPCYNPPPLGGIYCRQRTQLAKTSATQNASMVKDVPGELLPHTEDEWQEMISDQLENLPEDFDQERAIIDRAVDELEKNHHDTWLNMEQDYDYLGHAVDVITSAVDPAMSEQATDWNDDERNAFMQLLVQSGLSSSTSDTEAQRIISRALAQWRNGLLAESITPDLVNEVWSQFKANT